MVLLNKLIIQTFIAILLLLLPNFFGVFCGTKEIQSSLQLPPLDLEILNFLDIRLTLVFPIIQAFKLTITSDPLGITKTWVGSDVCSYRGFLCDNPPDNRSATAVASVDFNGFQLAAPSLNGFIDKLPDLAVFHANSNQFSGEVSPKISELPFLYELDLSNNHFSGVFPISVLRMNSLSFLDIRFNFFTGSVPPQIFAKSLDFLFLNNNNFDLTLPENLGSTPASYLNLANNGLTGPIPSTIGNASSTLVEVLFLNNLLTGCLPSEIGFLQNAIVFDAGNNLLAGPLPSSLGCLYKIEQMNFAGNSLSGKVPETVCQLGNLQNLSLSDNYFTSVGRYCKKLIKSGVLDLRRNCIPDIPDQRPANECAIFFLTPKTCPAQEVSDVNHCKSVSAQNQIHQSKRPMRKLVTYAALSTLRL